MINIIKPGYTLFFNSYLGDADYYNTEAITGLSRAQAQLLEKFAKLCVSGYNFPDKSIYARNDESVDFDKVLQHFSISEVENIFNAVWPDVVLDSYEPDQLEDALNDLVCECLGNREPYTERLPYFDFIKVAYFENQQVLQNTVG